MATPHHVSTTASGSRRRILRIGVLLGGKIIEERLIRDRSAVSIGQSAKNTFSVPLENLPREWTLFALDNGHYRLHFGPKMDGRVSDGAQVYTFEQVKGTKAVQHGEGWVMPLSDQARGKVSLGDLTLLFQFVTEPPVQPKPMLPASVRGTLADRIDPRLAVIAAISIVIHFGIALAAWLHDAKKPRSFGSRAAQISVDTYEEPLTLEPQPVPTGEQGKAEEGEKKPEAKPEKVAPSKKPSGGEPAGRQETDAAALQEEAARYAAALAADSEGSTGVDGAMGKIAPGGDLNAQMKEVRDSNANVKVGGGGDRGTRGDGDPRSGTGKGPKYEGPSGTESASGPGGKTEEKVPKGRIQVASKKTFDDTSLSPEAVLGRIQNVYMAGIKRCYKDLLKKDPSARGRVDLSFTVNESGRVTGPAAKSDYSDMSSCIKGLMAGWTFPPPKDTSGEATDASFAITLALQPD